MGLHKKEAGPCVPTELKKHHTQKIMMKRWHLNDDEEMAYELGVHHSSSFFN